MKIITIALTLIILIGVNYLLASNNEVNTGWCSQNDLSYGKPEVEVADTDLNEGFEGRGDFEFLQKEMSCDFQPKSSEQVCLDLLIKMGKLGTIETPKRDIAKYKLLNTKWYRMDYSLPLTEKGFYPVVKRRTTKKAEEICDNKRILEKAERLYKKL